MKLKEHTRNQKRMYRIHKQDEKIHDLELMIGKLQQENKQLKMINKEYERLDNGKPRGFVITRVDEYDIYDLLSYKENWIKLKEYAKEIISTDNELYGTDLLDKMQELDRGSGSDE